MEKTVLQKNLDRLLAARGESALAASKAAGLPPSGIRDILRGRSRSPRGETLKKLADHFGVSIEELTGGEIRGQIDGTGAVQAGDPDPDLLAKVLEATRTNLAAMEVELPPRQEAELVTLLYRHIRRNQPDSAAAEAWLRDMIRVVS